MKASVEAVVKLTVLEEAVMQLVQTTWWDRRMWWKRWRRWRYMKCGVDVAWTWRGPWEKGCDGSDDEDKRWCMKSCVAVVRASAKVAVI